METMETKERRERKDRKARRERMERREESWVKGSFILIISFKRFSFNQRMGGIRVQGGKAGQ
jgi:hypothetical protein